MTEAELFTTSARPQILIKSRKYARAFLAHLILNEEGEIGIIYSATLPPTEESEYHFHPLSDEQIAQIERIGDNEALYYSPLILH